MEFELKAGRQGHVYFPKRIRAAFGDKMKFLPNTNAAVIFPEKADLEAVIESLRVIITDLELRTKVKKPSISPRDDSK
jgi:hypothetical protein